MESQKTIPPPEEKKLWFRAKTYGYGWYPASWQGWAVISIYVILVIISAWDILRGAEGGVPAVKRFVLTILALSIFLVYFSYTHGEKPGWSWGKKDTKHDTDAKD